MSTSPLSYLILVVDICPSVQQHLHNGEMPISRGKEKGRAPPLHHIDREGEMVLPPPLLIHAQAHLHLPSILH